MHLRVLKNVSISLLEAYVEQVFPVTLSTWTPLVIQQEDIPDSFELFISYSTEYRALEFPGDGTYEYCGPLDFDKQVVETATKWEIIQYRRFIIPDWALPVRDPWVYENREAWVSPLHFYWWRFSAYSRAHSLPIHHNFVPEDDPMRNDAGDEYPKHGVWFYLQGFPLTFPLVIPISPAGLPVDFSPTSFEDNAIVSYCILPNFVHHLSSFLRISRKCTMEDVSGFINHYAKMQPVFVVPAGTEFSRAHVECGQYSCVVGGFLAQAFGNGLAPVAGDPMIPLEYMDSGVIRLPGVKWVIECIYKQTMSKWFSRR